MWTKIRTYIVEKPEKAVAIFVLVGMVSGFGGTVLSFADDMLPDYVEAEELKASEAKTQRQIAKLENTIKSDTIAIQLSLLNMKYPNSTSTEHWSLEDQKKYNQLISAEIENEKLRVELSDQPAGLPE